MPGTKPSPASFGPAPPARLVVVGAPWFGVWGEGGGGPFSGGGPPWSQRRSRPARWVPARSRAGIQAFSRESPDAKSRGGNPRPPELWPARYSLARFGGCAALFRWWGYYGAHLRALIWDAFFV